MPQLPQVLARRARLALVGSCLVACAWLVGIPALQAAPADGAPKLELLFQAPLDSASRLFLNPQGVACDTALGRVYVADTGHNQVIAFNTAGVLQYSFKHRADHFSGERIPGEPWRLLAGEQGTVLVADRLGDKVDIVDAWGTAVESIDVTAALGGKDRASPGAMGRDAEGRLYILEHTTGQVLVFDKARRLVRQFGIESPLSTRYKSTVDMAVATDGTLYVLDNIDEPVVRVYGPDGKRKGDIGRHGAKGSDFHMPAAIALDGAGRLWIADGVSHDVKLYTTDGKFLAVFGGMGLGPGQFYFPSSVTVASGVLYVLERAGARLQAFKIVGP